MQHSFTSHADYKEFFSAYWPTIASIDRWAESNEPGYPGYCAPCQRFVELRVERNADFGEATNLRETLSCPCGLSNRTRLLLTVLSQNARSGERVALFEHGSALAKRLQSDYRVSTSAYLGPSARSGEKCKHNGQSLVHQDMCKTSYDNDSFDVVIHNDCLEHIPDYLCAIEECQRILAPGGHMICTFPFFGQNRATKVRARHDGDRIINLLPPEVHGDPMHPNGILAFYNFGWDIIDQIRSVFGNCSLELIVDPLLGFLSNNCPAENMNMPPVVLVAKKRLTTERKSL